MPVRPVALILPQLAFVVLIAACAPVSGAPKAVFLSSFVWDAGDPMHGGFSGIEVSDDGTRFVSVTDKGYIAEGTLLRAGDAITGVGEVSFERLDGLDGQALPQHLRGDERSYQDAEGLATGPDGSLYVSFEGVARIWRYGDRETPPDPIPAPRDFEGLQMNSGLEALAINQRGAIFTLPERSGQQSRPFPLFRFADGRWTVAYRIPRRGDFLPVGADFGPDGRLYLLERKFAGILGFSSRVRRFVLGRDGRLDQETLLTTGFMQHGNLEGISVWRDVSGAFRMTMIEDDNFSVFQRTQLVEYRVTQ